MANGTIHTHPKSEMRDRVRDIELGKQNLRFLFGLCIQPWVPRQIQQEQRVIVLFFISENRDPEN